MCTEKGYIDYFTVIKSLKPTGNISSHEYVVDKDDPDSVLIGEALNHIKESYRILHDLEASSESRLISIVYDVITGSNRV